MSDDRKPCFGFFDLDSAAYAGASAVQKDRYKWVNKITGEESIVFEKAKEAKAFMDEEVMFGADEEEWERIKFQEVGTLQEALKATEDAVNSFVKTFKKLACKERPLKYTGFLTRSGVSKNKDIKGLEDQYQFNRVGLEKPIYLEDCKNHILTVYDWVKLAASGYEADAPVIGFCERKGYDGVILSIDKDLKQAENVFFVDMNKDYSQRKLVKTTSLGYLDERLTASGQKVMEGHGFKLLCYQAIVGDVSDGYKGLRGIGHTKGLALLKDCTSKEECVRVMLEVYKDKLGESYTYTSWDGVEQTRTPEELLDQHFKLAYQERSSTDMWDLYKHLRTKEETNEDS